MKGIHIVIIVGILAAALLIGYNMSQDDTMGEKLDNAAEQIKDGVDNAADAVGDAVEDAGDAVGDAANDAGDAVEDSTNN